MDTGGYQRSQGIAHLAPREHGESKRLGSPANAGKPTVTPWTFHPRIGVGCHCGSMLGCELLEKDLAGEGAP